MLFDHGGDFEVVAIGLRSLLMFLSPEFRRQRAGFMAKAEEKWKTLSKEDQDEWISRLEKTRLALGTGAFKTESKLLETIDALFEGPPRSDQTGTITTTGDLMAAAHLLWKAFSDLKSPTDMQIVDAAANRIAVNTASLKVLLHGYRWTEAGFPTIKISPRFAAAAMCTTLQPEVQAVLRSPWRSFVIMMPKESVLYHFPIDDPLPVRYIIVLWVDQTVDEKGQLKDDNIGGRHWTYSLVTTQEMPATHRYNLKSSDLCSSHLESNDLMPWPTIEDRDEKALMLAGRIISSTICAFTDPEMSSRIDKENHDTWRKRPVPPRRAEDAHPLVFQITAPVTIDLVERVKEYQLKHPGGKSWKLNLRMVVGGHWKMQVCGKGRMGRKEIWIQPYERGPQSAPLAVRDHIIKDE
jgi:hypothetical protein